MKHYGMMKMGTRRQVAKIVLIGILAIALVGCGLLPGSTGSEEAQQQLEQLDLSQLELVIQTEQLEQKFQQLEPDADGNLRVTFTEEELNQAVVIRRENASGDQATDLQNTFLRFQNDEVVLSSTISGLFDGELEARFEPQVENDALQLDLIEARIGQLDVPRQFLGGLESTLNSGLGVLLRNLPTTYTLRNVEIRDGSLTLIAEPNETNQ